MSIGDSRLVSGTSTVSAASAVDSVDWVGFEGFLSGKKFRKCYQRDLLSYAKRYSHFLFNGNLSAVESVSGSRMVLAGLANLSKFLGCYREFKRMREEAGVKWSEGSSESVFAEIYGGQEATDSVEAWIDSLSEKVGWGIWFPTVFCALSGLRTGEAIASLNLVADGDMEKGYLNRDFGVLEHFRYKETFIRRSKKAFITVLSDGLLEELKSWKQKTTYDKMRSMVRRKGIECRFYDCRKWFASTLRASGLESEFIDLLEGRCSGSIFQKSYWRPQVKVLFEKTRKVLEPYEKRWLR